MTTTMTTQQLIAQIEALKLQNETLWEMMLKGGCEDSMEFIVNNIGNEEAKDIFPKEYK